MYIYIVKIYLDKSITYKYRIYNKTAHSAEASEENDFLCENVCITILYMNKKQYSEDYAEEKCSCCESSSATAHYSILYVVQNEKCSLCKC